ncbi:hypothetical protein MHBO_001238 [Bonamia ostreae]|uniref:Uncharacterized protein n=1 Tax=Bonamia ostreae TaxID=126728 RepID=A0ABV2AI90_9EUKA
MKNSKERPKRNKNKNKIASLEKIKRIREGDASVFEEMDSNSNDLFVHVTEKEFKDLAEEKNEFIVGSF